MVSYARTPSPIGPLLLVGDNSELSQIQFATNSRSPSPQPDWTDNPAAFVEPIRQLRAYFAGDLETFDLALSPQGTPFQQTVWNELCKIPYGQTISYGDLARRIGQPSASRAVGLANGRNPVAIVVPCHRVIGADGSLTGYGGGMDRKRFLLALEQRASGQTLI